LFVVFSFFTSADSYSGLRGQVKKYVGIIFEKHLKFAMLKTYILPKYYKSSTSDEHLIGRQHCNSEFILINLRGFRLTPKSVLASYFEKIPILQCKNANSFKAL